MKCLMKRVVKETQHKHTTLLLSLLSSFNQHSKSLSNIISAPSADTNYPAPAKYRQSNITMPMIWTPEAKIKVCKRSLTESLL